MTSRGLEVLVDVDDYEWLSQFHWILSGGKAGAGGQYPSAYIRRDKGSYTFKYMHRMVIGALKGQFVDHINGNTLDNRKENLRLCTRSQNGANRGKTQKNKTRYKGVSYQPHKSKPSPWVSKIMHNKKAIHLGSYSSQTEAAIAYNVKAKELFGEFAHANILD